MNLDSDIRRHFQPLEKKQSHLMNQVLQKLKPQYKQSQQQLKSLENTTSSEQILRECAKSLREFEQRLQTLEATLKNELGTY
jgi:predicted patatin/cPLA2 family phospholipase